MKEKLDDRIVNILDDGESHGEWDIASRLYDWNDRNRAKHGAWIRVIVQALWRLESQGEVGHFWVEHGCPGYGVPGDRMWFKQ